MNFGRFRPVTAAVLAALMVLGAAGPAAAGPRRDQQWYLDALRIDAAHKVSTGRGVVVAVVDTGVDAGHPDLAGRVLAGARSDGRRGDGRADEDGHGTHMAGIIAATGANRDGVLGIAPGAKILPIKTRQGAGDADRSAVALGIRLAADRGAKVINVSYSGGGLAGGEAEAVAYALSKDAVVVAGAGNVVQGGSDIGFPANVPGVIAVTGYDRQGSFWTGSAQGPAAVVAAPSVHIYNTLNSVDGQPGYGWADGTSDATAIVSGLAALVRARYPNLDAANVVNRIIRTAQDAGPAGRDTQYGFGRIDPMAALTAKVPAVPANPLLATAASAAPTGAGEGDEPLDLSRYDDGGPTDQQVMVIGIGIAVVLVVLLVLAVFLIWNRRRYRREVARAGDVPDELLDRMAVGGYGSPGTSSPPVGHGPPGAPPQPGVHPSSSHGPAPSGYPPGPGYGPPAPGAHPGGYPPPPDRPPPGGNRS